MKYTPSFLPVICLSFLVFLLPIGASHGDRDPLWRRCVLDCEHARCGDSDTAKLPLLLELTFWTCEENCRYDCMHNVTSQRVNKGLPVYQYHGKWPFIRVLGLQELASVVFSIANAVPHIWMLRRFSSPDYATQPYSRNIRAWNVVALNTWLWSTVFHARDFYITERLDYYFSAHLLYMSAEVAVVYTFKMASSCWRALVFVLFNACWLGHISYLHFVHMDYGLHMRCTLSMGVLYLLLWSRYIYRHWAAPHTKLQLLALAVTLAAVSMEVGDFPPYWGLFDAHSLWHACTPVAGFLTYAFFSRDLQKPHMP